MYTEDTVDGKRYFNIHYLCFATSVRFPSIPDANMLGGQKQASSIKVKSDLFSVY